MAGAQPNLRDEAEGSSDKKRMTHAKAQSRQGAEYRPNPPSAHALSLDRIGS